MPCCEGGCGTGRVPNLQCILGDDTARHHQGVHHQTGSGAGQRLGLFRRQGGCVHGK